ncbi:MAG TPA: hypothetical protein VLJ79_04840 [Candidatus Binatia bacterium]|nr:hypothetical protein [Candidatus Binatia bacterium]
MKPSQSILDKTFQYVPSVETSVADTWRRFGWHPTTEDERRTQQRHRNAHGAKRVVIPFVGALSSDHNA